LKDGSTTDYDPGTSILGNQTLKFRVQGTLNKRWTKSTVDINEILVNPPKDVSASDVHWKTTMTP
jgi:hypothetical protein